MIPTVNNDFQNHSFNRRGGGAASALAVLRLRIILRRQVDRLYPMQNELSHSNCPLENITVGHDSPVLACLA
jgi:hypothetical protein